MVPMPPTVSEPIRGGRCSGESIADGLRRRRERLELGGGRRRGRRRWNVSWSWGMYVPKIPVKSPNVLAVQCRT